MSAVKNEFQMPYSEEMPIEIQVLSMATTLKQEYTETDPGSLKSKRKRTAFNSFHLIQLEREFVSSNYLDKTRRFSIAQRLCLPEKVIKIWFQNRRMKSKKENKSPEANPITAYNSQPKTEQTVHKDTVQRLMAYSRLPAMEVTNRISYTTSSDRHTACALDLNEILNLLEESPAQVTHSSSSISPNNSNHCTDGLAVQTIQQDLEFSTVTWVSNHNSSNNNTIIFEENAAVQHCQQLPQQPPNIDSVTSIPSMNLIWEEPTSKKQRHL